MDAEPALFCSLRNGIKDLYNREEQRNGEMFCPESWWLSGPTGCNKTRSCLEKFPEACVLHCEKDMWFDEYNGAETVVFDEFRHDSMPYTKLLAMTTWNKGMKMRIKGSFVWFHPKRIIFTSPESPDKEFSYRARDGGELTLRDDYAQLKRRLTNIV